MLLAKSHPKETIEEHTNKLLGNLELLKSMYPSLKYLNWDILEQACLYHDLGKVNSKFQEKISSGKRDSSEIPHNLLSTTFVDTKGLKERYSLEEITVMLHAIAWHHERGQYEIELIRNEIEDLKNQVKKLDFKRIKINKIRLAPLRYFENKRITEDNNGEDVYLNYVMTKGLLNRLDYAASSGIEVEIKNDFLNGGLEHLLELWKIKKSNSQWNDMQKFLKDNTDENVIVIGETGMGKTEGGLLWIGDNKGFFTLPLKTAINSIYDRILKDIVPVDSKSKVGLLHSDTLSEYIKRNEKEDDNQNEIDLSTYINQTKQLSLPLTITTIDQLFKFVFKYRNYELLPATLSYSKIVLDEIQMYSPQLLAYLIVGLKYITKLGGKFAIITATFPEVIYFFLEKEGIKFKQAAKPYILVDRFRHHIKVLEDNINSDFILNTHQGNKVLVICNTIKKAQEIYSELKLKIEEMGRTDEVHLLHSKFIRKDRNIKEEIILEDGKTETEKSVIWVTTQIVEASLDIDFDILITELSDLSGLFQRMGRCNRKGEKSSDAVNCFVFNGGEVECSGVGFSVDGQIHHMSKEELGKREGILTEQDKIDMISNIFSYEKMKDTKYFNEVKNNIRDIKNVIDYEDSKSDVDKKFRGINSVDVIPEKVYVKNKESIKKLENEINLELPKDIEKNSLEHEAFKLKKVKARDELRNYYVSITKYHKNDNFVHRATIEVLKLGKFNTVPIIRCEYDDEIGLVATKDNEGVFM